MSRELAWLSLEGLSVGDAFGEMFLHSFPERLAWLAARQLPPGIWRVTDDTVMALGILDVLERHGRIEQDELARTFASNYWREPGRGYGGTAHRILTSIREGVPWRMASQVAFGGQGSMGNGGAMRAGPVGAYFAGDLERVVAEARASAEVTHAHPDGQAGAIAVACAAAWAARRGRTGKGAGRWKELLEFVHAWTPEGATREGIEAALGLPEDVTAEQAALSLGNGKNVIASDTVPFCLWCAGRHLEDYSEALWVAASALGDIDTNCAIVGSIVSLSAGGESIPVEWLAQREPLPFR